MSLEGSNVWKVQANRKQHRWIAYILENAGIISEDQETDISLTWQHPAITMLPYSLWDMNYFALPQGSDCNNKENGVEGGLQENLSAHSGHELSWMVFNLRPTTHIREKGKQLHLTQTLLHQKLPSVQRNDPNSISSFLQEATALLQGRSTANQVPSAAWKMTIHSYRPSIAE